MEVFTDNEMTTAGEEIRIVCDITADDNLDVEVSWLRDNENIDLENDKYILETEGKFNYNKDYFL